MIPGTSLPDGRAELPPAGSQAAPVREGLLADRTFVEVRFGGSGGQGVLLMGVVLAVAANHDHRCVVQTETYGPEARGGSSRSDVIISDLPIDYPKLDSADLLLALSVPAANSYIKSLRRTGVFIYDSGLIEEPPAFSGTTFGIPFSHLAKEEIGRVQTANSLALGAVVGITGIVSVESLRKAIIEAVPSGTEEINAKALARGLQAAEEC